MAEEKSMRKGKDARINRSSLARAFLLMLLTALFIATSASAAPYIQKSAGGQIIYDALQIFNDTSSSGFFSSCPAGYSIRAINANGSVTCEYDDATGTMDNWLLAASGTGGTETISEGDTANITGSYINPTRSTNTITITNSDPGSTELIFKTVTGNSGSAATDINNDAITISGTGMTSVNCVESSPDTCTITGTEAYTATEDTISNISEWDALCTGCVTADELAASSVGKTEIDETVFQVRVNNTCDGSGQTQSGIQSISQSGTVTCSSSCYTYETDPQVSSYVYDNYVCYGTGSDIRCDDNGLYWDRSSHRLGIGTTLVGYPLQVTGTATATDFTCSNCLSSTEIDSSIQEDIYGSCGSNTVIQQIYQGGSVSCSSNAFITSETDGQISTTYTYYGCYGNGGSDIFCDDSGFYISSGGNLGINDASPGYPLEVGGTANFNNGAIYQALRYNGIEALWYNGYYSWGYGAGANYFPDYLGLYNSNPTTGLHVGTGTPDYADSGTEMYVTGDIDIDGVLYALQFYDKAFSEAYTERVCWRNAANTWIYDCTGSPGDYAEWYRAADGELLEPGYIVVPVREEDPETGNKFAIKVSTTPKQEGIFGVVSTDPYEISGEDVLPAGVNRTKDVNRTLLDHNGQTYGAVAMMGRVPVKATNENGKIEQGDLLTSSSTPGFAMKLRPEESGSVIGKAIEPLRDGEDTVLILMMPGTYASPQDQKIQELEQEFERQELELADLKAELSQIKQQLNSAT